jgi:hypothetical protein
MTRTAVLLPLLLLGACGDGDDVAYPQEVGACDGLLDRAASADGLHMPIGTPIEWSTNPPAIGAHYPIWAGWDRHYPQLERAYYVHNLEHGGVALLYNCPSGCPDVVESLLEIVRTAKSDSTCEGVVRHRLIVAADRLLPAEVQVAAVAWGKLYTASCFDPYVATFVRTQYRHGPEDTCADGAPMNGSLITTAP